MPEPWRANPGQKWLIEHDDLSALTAATDAYDAQPETAHILAEAASVLANGAVPLGGEDPEWAHGLSDVKTDDVLFRCPSCDAANVGLRRWIDARRWVRCRICDMTGPTKCTEAEARDAWNALPRCNPDDLWWTGIHIGLVSGMTLLVHQAKECYEQNKPLPDALKAMAKAARGSASREALLDAVRFYADPESYHAIMILPDRPAGAFADDFSDDHGHEFYDREMPGKKAREVLNGVDHDG